MLTGGFRLVDGTGALVAEARGHRIRRLSAERIEALERALIQERAAPAMPAPPSTGGSLDGQEFVDFLIERAAHHLELEPDQVPRGVPLRELGLDSITGLSLRRDIEERLSLRVPAELLIEGPSIDSLAGTLLGQRTPARAEPPRLREPSPWFGHVVRREKPAVRLFCFPYGGGGASVYQGWERLPESIEVWPVQLPGREGRIHEPPLSALEPVLEALESALTPLLDRPFAFYGHSLGGLLAYLTTARLRARGLPQPRHLMIGGFSAPFLAPGPYLLSVRQRFQEAGLPGIPSPHEPAPLAPMLEILMSTEEGRTLAGSDPDFARALLPMMLADLKLVESYRFQPEPPLELPLTVFHAASDDRVTEEGSEGWRAFTTGPFHKH
ncbi:MAG TPA: alpha/beta fold hydrolase, partial [Myxococcaceae bacterium]|nr:alpha/beta fold hydrolase [Myxococcaceae bacterium]